MSELKACPFCGGLSIIYRAPQLTNWIVACSRSSCGAQMERGGAKASAIAAWNSRPAPTDEGMREAIETYAREASKALSRLSGGGSEMFTKIGSEYYADPKLCVGRAEHKVATIARTALRSTGGEGG